MANENIATYLNDHLAGSVAALELIDNLLDTHSESDLTTFFTHLKADIASDRDELQGMMQRLDIDESRTRKASAWIAEKMTELKLRFDDPTDGALRLFESLEGLSLGIEGKHSLWIALSVSAEKNPLLQIADYERLKKRAREQRERVEKLRLQFAAEALAFDQHDQRKVAKTDAST